MVLREYFAFTSRKTRLIFNYLIPFLALLLGAFIGMGSPVMGLVFAAVIILYDDVICDSMTFSNIYSKDNQSLDFIKSACNGMKHLYSALIGDQLVRFLRYLIPMMACAMIEKRISFGELVYDSLPASPRLTTGICLALFYFMASDISTMISRHCTYIVFSMLGAIGSLLASALIVIPILYFIKNKVIACIVLGILAFAVSSLIHYLSVRALKKQFFDKE